MKIDQAGIDLIKEFEGLVDNWYPDPATGGPPMTCCYGHTDAAGEPKYADDPGRQFTEQECEDILVRDVGQYEDAVEKNCPGPKTQNQFNAMVSLTFNIGPANFDGSSVERYHNEQNYPQAAESFLLWNKANGVVMEGLVRRREAEKALYETPDTIVAEVPESGVSPEEGEHPPPVYDYLIADSSQPEGGWERVDDVTVWRRARR